MRSLYALLIGFILDMLIGDPHGFPHPVILIGKLISWLEVKLRAAFPQTQKGERTAGLVLWILVAGISTAVPALILWGLSCISFWLALAVESIMCWQILAAKSLRDESMKVYDALKYKGLQEARHAVSMIVGRDTDRLDEAGVTRAAVETVAENTSDGVIAPLLFMAVLGAPLGFFYKAVNTMDSMLGYTDPPYDNIGLVPARADDIMNFIPARIAALLMLLTGVILEALLKPAQKDDVLSNPAQNEIALSNPEQNDSSRIKNWVKRWFQGIVPDSRNGWKIFMRDRYNHASPNSAQTESVCAGLLGVQLAGDAWYHGHLHKKKYIGDPNREIEYEDIPRSNVLMYGTSLCALVIFCIVRILIVLL